MTDLHTHILPGMDDGAVDIESALQMLREEAKQGVGTVALTPHFYRMKESVSSFLGRRAASFKSLKSAVGDEPLPRLVLSAEVSYVHGMADWDDLELFCYEGTKILLVEPQMTPWNDEMFRELYAVEGRRGITPMIAHAERYFAVQKKERMQQLLEMGFPIQVSAFSLLGAIGRKKAMNLLTKYNAILVSDCHNTTTRSPNIGDALKVLRKKLGNEVDYIAQNTDEVLFW